MATKSLKSLKGRVVRITRLDECGVPVTGACSTIVTAGFITVGFSPEKESGEEYLQKNAWGDFCIQEKDRDRTKWVNTTISLCEVNPDVLDIIGGATPLTDGTDTIGASFGVDGSTAAFALEVWTKQAGGTCEDGSPEWGYWVAPYIRNGNIDGDVTIENGVLALNMMGEAQPAPADWGVGPYGDNPLLDAGGMPTGDLWAVATTSVQPPATTGGCVALS